MTVYRAALIGLSWISIDPAVAASSPTLGSGIPYSHASAMAPIPEIQVVAGCDISAEARAAFLDRWSERWPGIRAYERYEDLFANEQVDIVSVVTPDHLHVPVVLRAIEAGAKAIFCEKPLATSPAEAWQIVNAVKKAGIPVNINYTRRWAPEYVEARRLVRAGSIGPLSQIVVESGGPRAMLFRNHTHTIDFLNYFAESDPTWVWAELEPGFESYGTTYTGDGGRDPATEPAVNAYVAYANGVRAFLTGLKTNAQELVVHLIGRDGRLVIDSEGLRLVANERQTSRAPVPGAEGPKVHFIEPKWSTAGMQAAILDLIAALETGRPVQSPVEEAWKTVAITDAILRSQAGGNVRVDVSLDPPAG